MSHTPRIIEGFVTKADPEAKKTVSVTGALRDTQEGKYRFDLIGLHMLKRLAALLERGAKKYSERNWEKGQETSRTLASLWRHVVAYQEGDREEDHLAAIVFNAMSIMHVEGEVARGKLPAALLDIPFYADLTEVQEAVEEPTWHEQIILDELPEYNQFHRDRSIWVEFADLKKITFPSVSEHEFAQVMAALTRKGLVCPAVVMERVHPDYALKTAVDAKEDHEFALANPRTFDDDEDSNYDAYDYEGDEDDDEHDSRDWQY